MWIPIEETAWRWFQTIMIAIVRPKKTLKFQLALWTSNSCSLHFSVKFADDLIVPLSIGQVRMKGYLPCRTICLSRPSRQHFFQALCCKQTIFVFVHYLRGLEWLPWLKAGWSIWPLVRTVWRHRGGRYHFLSPALEILLWPSRISNCDERWW